MDAFYDKARAAELIESLAKERQTQHLDAYYLSNISLSKEWQKHFNFIQRLNPPEWQLVFNGNGQSETVSETVLVVHGAVCGLNLPPLRARVKYLSEAAGDRYVYTDHNEIFYYERKTSESGKREFMDISSSKIQVGDIVEVHMTFIAMPVKDGKKKVASTLRSVTLLDGNLTEMAIAAKSNLRLQASMAPRKRSVHDREMINETGQKFSRMKIRDGEKMDSSSHD
ncbi:hypothetical protein EV421DRAFT_1917347 [Armillaria borealis]|uniref:Uncharacterized protein n=1 Tax=Armillaria borealis TaxID=47425 RepID=A0AA39IBS3_9AGAR|nr:hypothetical protein EV421DRAFT_1917347 [Armillaria borealis]